MDVPQPAGVTGAALGASAAVPTASSTVPASVLAEPKQKPKDIATARGLSTGAKWGVGVTLFLVVGGFIGFFIWEMTSMTTASNTRVTYLVFANNASLNQDVGGLTYTAASNIEQNVKTQAKVGYGRVATREEVQAEVATVRELCKEGWVSGQTLVSVCDGKVVDTQPKPTPTDPDPQHYAWVILSGISKTQVQAIAADLDLGIINMWQTKNVKVAVTT